MITPIEAREIARRLVVIVGPSGSGKSTAERSVCERHDILRLRSATTRTRRDGEAADAYHWTPRAAFDLAARCGGMVEHVTYNGQRYGLEWRELKTALREKGCRGALIVLTADGLEVLRHYAPVWAVWLECPDEVLRPRLARRGDGARAIEARLNLATAERANAQRVGMDFVLDATMPAPWVSQALWSVVCAARLRNPDTTTHAPVLRRLMASECATPSSN